MFSQSDPAEKADDRTDDKNDDMNSEPGGDRFFLRKPNHQESSCPPRLQGAPVSNPTDRQGIRNDADGRAKKHFRERDVHPEAFHIGIEAPENHDPGSQACQTDGKISSAGLDRVKIFCHLRHFLLNPQNESNIS